MIPIIHSVYLAGLFDGEGCAGVWKLKHRKTPAPIVTLSMTTRAPVKFCHDIYGGYFRDGFKKIPGNKSVYEWRVSHRQALKVAMDLIPYVRNPEKIEQLGRILEHYGVV